MSGGFFYTTLNPCRLLLSLSTRIKHLRSKHFRKVLYNMNEAYIHHENGQETFQFTFRFVNADLNVDRQFNMMRKSNELVGTFLRRLDGNLNRYLKKKKKKAKKNTPEEEESVQEDNVETGKLALVRNDSKIDLNTPCGMIFQDTSQMTLQVFDMPYKVRINFPWIKNMALSKSILADFPTYPIDFEAVHTDKEKSLFIWYINRSKAPCDSKKYTSAWEEVARGFLYTPRTSEIGYRLKVRGEPANEDQIGPAIEVEAGMEIEAGPGQTPFETRHAFTSERLSAKNFRVTSYNILADTYASTDYSKTVLFPYCPAYALSIDYRKQLIVKELIGYNSDIICLQEVDHKVFNTDLHPALSMLHYDGIFNRKGLDLSEGIATFYDERRFEKIFNESRVMSHNVELPGFSEVWDRIQNETVKARFLRRNTTVQTTVLRSKENPEEILVVGNTHLYFQPDADHIRLLQGYYTLKYCQNIAREIRENLKTRVNVNIVLCGDFNSTPDCGIYQLMTKNYVPADHNDWSSNPSEIVEDVSLNHDSTFASACGTPPYTNFTVEFADCLDYIFYESNNLEVTQVVPLPSKEELSLNEAIPSVVFPSDHVALCADLKWKECNFKE